MWAVAKMLGGHGVGSATTRAEAIRAHLACLLGTRQGQSPAALRYGVLGGAERLRGLLERWPHSLGDIEAAIWWPIAAHEPRLQRLHWAAPAVLSARGLTLQLAASLTGSDDVIALKLRICARGHVDVDLS